jgi:hypothetical protein
MQEDLRGARAIRRTTLTVIATGCPPRRNITDSTHAAKAGPAHQPAFFVVPET